MKTNDMTHNKSRLPVKIHNGHKANTRSFIIIYLCQNPKELTVVRVKKDVKIQMNAEIVPNLFGTLKAKPIRERPKSTHSGPHTGYTNEFEV